MCRFYHNLRLQREDHCERAGYLHLLRAILCRVSAEGGTLADCSGNSYMYVSHFPCISCITVISQVVRHLPAVQIDVSYDNMWKTRFKTGRADARPDAWRVFDVME